MSNLFDNHNHSEFSFDGKNTSVLRSAKAAADKGMGGICFSDHCDYFIPEAKLKSGEYVPEYFDINEQQNEIERVQALVPQIKILKGIEVGIEKSVREMNRKTLDENKFDQVIASVHYLDGVDPWLGEYYIDRDWKEAYGHYLETIFTETTWLKDFDIIGHFDYVVRYAPYHKRSMMYRDFSDIFDEIFKFAIHNGKAIEINTKSYGTHNGRVTELDKNVLLRYRELGGEILSLGSDSHDCSKTGDKFEFFAEYFKSLGFRYTAHYEGRRLVQIPL